MEGYVTKKWKRVEVHPFQQAQLLMHLYKLSWWLWFRQDTKTLPAGSPKGAYGEVKDALTMLPKLPTEALEYVAQRIEEGTHSVGRD